MKKIKCTDVGGPEGCTHVFEVKDFEDFMTKAHAHFGSEHADMVKDVTEEQKQEWSAMAKGVVEAAPEEATTEE